MFSEAEVRSPRFSGASWLAFPALHAAYKHVQLELEFRPETWDGVLLLAGERDDLQGDFMALILHHGYVEFRYVRLRRLPPIQFLRSYLLEEDRRVISWIYQKFSIFINREPWRLKSRCCSKFQVVLSYNKF